MPSGRSGKNHQSVRNARSTVSSSNPRPWGTIAAVMVVVVFAGAIGGFLYLQYDQSQQTNAALERFTPSGDNRDPSTQIRGIQIRDVEARGHVGPAQRVNYPQVPPVGGPHDYRWAGCNGVVYEQPVRTENMIHPLEHGAVWISYNPRRLPESQVQQLAERVDGEEQLMLSPIPTQQAPISLQSWGHQLTVRSANDPRIDRFIRALRLNQYQYPEVGATCQPHPDFPTDDPPDFNPRPTGGPNTVSMSYSGSPTGLGG